MIGKKYTPKRLRTVFSLKMLEDAKKIRSLRMKRKSKRKVRKSRKRNIL